MRTIIKWPGGKSGEIEKIKDIIPTFDRYIEPFFGGGAVYFALEPKKAFINDLSELLMTFYKLIKRQDTDLKYYLLAYDKMFQSLMTATENNYEKILSCYNNDGSVVDLVRMITDKSYFDASLIPNRDDYMAFVIKMVKDKFLRTRKNQIKRPFSKEDLKNNLQTGFASGYYMYFRYIYNKLAQNDDCKDAAYKIANFYFIREYCYGSMFRYNAKGEFNIPYGGISYNTKNFRAKIDRLFNDEIANLFHNTVLSNQDFEQFLSDMHLTKKDFVFLDPPYDTEFSDYDAHAFNKKDQKRLSTFLKNTKAQFILIIKNTDYIYGLYENCFRILAFDKSYTYNVRSRNDRQVEHLIITNIID